ncbi:MAG: carbohydrate kinase family protein [Candidatus Competibacteraceae bacterium]|nr:carbohydrate kinase family protein [Candidatus Competibacteraceae bacterium]
MDIVGGLYQELCETPTWDAVFGSGGRAAAALTGVSPSIRLHTYVAPGPATAAADALRCFGVRVEAFPRAASIIFSYLHPLSNPHIEPPTVRIPQSPALRVTGEAVLRFGLLEGDAIVDADRAVFDPQTARRLASFRANGSRAGHLALVLNEGELRAVVQDGDLHSAARKVMADEQAEVLVLKRGVRGALVLEGETDPCPVPAYRSSTVFKIGTGDVFSAWFAYLWAERGISAAEAADRASRAVAAYAQSRTLPPPAVNLAALVIGDRPGRSGSKAIRTPWASGSFLKRRATS